MKTIVLMEMTLDGIIAKNSEQPNANWITKADAKLFREKIREAGAVIMGNNTHKTLGRNPLARLNIVMTRNPDLQTSIPDQLEFTSDEPKKILADLAKRRFREVIICGGAEINSLFLLDDLISELWVIVEPKLSGKGLGLFSEMDLDERLELITDPVRLGVNSLLIKYRIIR